MLSCSSKSTPRFDTTDEKPSGPVDSATSLTATLDSCGRITIQSSWALSGFIFKRWLLIQLSMLMMQSDRRRAASTASALGSWYADVHLRIVGVRVTFEAVCCKDLGDLSLYTAGKAAGPVRSLVGHRTRGGWLLIAVHCPRYPRQVN